MSIDKLIDELEDILEASWHLPLSGGKAIMDSEEIKKIIEDIRLKLPQEIVQAKKIVQNRSEIIEDARNEAETMLKVSEEKIKIMVNKNEIVKVAQATADSIINEANTRAREIKSSANEYIQNAMKQLDETIASSLSEIRKARQALRTSDITPE